MRNDDGEVLDEGDPDHHPTVTRAQLTSVDEEARHHHRAGHGDHDPDDEPLGGRPAEDDTRAETHADGEEDAKRCAQQRDTPHLEQIAERELETDREHQEDDTDLGEELEGVEVGHRGPRRERADENAAEHVAEDQRLTCEPRQAAAEDGGREHVGQVAEDQRLGHHAAVSSSKCRPAAGVPAETDRSVLSPDGGATGRSRRA